MSNPTQNPNPDNLNFDPEFLCDENKSAFQLLQVPEDCENDQLIRDHYLTIAKNVHPDKASSSEEKENREVAMMKVNSAYSSIKTAETRRIYRLAKTAVGNEKNFSNSIDIYRVSAKNRYQERVYWPGNLDTYWKTWTKNLLLKPISFNDPSQVTFDPNTFIGYIRFAVIPFTLRLRMKLILEAKRSPNEVPLHTKSYDMFFDFPYQMTTILPPTNVTEVENVFFKPKISQTDKVNYEAAQKKIDDAVFATYFNSGDDTRMGQRTNMSREAIIQNKKQEMAMEILRGIQTLKCSADIPNDFEMLISKEMSKASQETGLNKLLMNAELKTLTSAICSPVEIDKLAGKYANSVKEFRFYNQLPRKAGNVESPIKASNNNIEYEFLNTIQNFNPESIITQEQQVKFAELCSLLISFISESKATEHLNEFSDEIRLKFGEIPKVYIPSTNKPLNEQAIQVYVRTEDEGTDISIGWPTGKKVDETDIVHVQERLKEEQIYGQPFCVDVPILLITYHRIHKSRIFLLNLITGEAAGTYSISKAKLALGIGAAAVVTGVNEFTRGVKKLFQITKDKFNEVKQKQEAKKSNSNNS